ncbi:MAG TPA: hypothetical protein VIH35_08595 [Kiritimatiellia bacterium]
MQRRASTNAYVSAALSRSRVPTAVLAQKPQVFERVLKQNGQEPTIAMDSCLTMPALGRVWKELAARLA